MTNEEAIQKSLELLIKYDTYDSDYTLDIGNETGSRIGPIYELKFYRSGVEMLKTEYEWVTAKLHRKIYFKDKRERPSIVNDWDSDETIVKEFDIKQIKRDYKLGLLGIKKNPNK